MYISQMTKRYSIAQARSSLPTIVDQAEAGQEIELTRRGEAVAVVLSLREFQRLRSERPPFRDAYRLFLTKHALADVGLDAHDLAPTRDKTPGRTVAL